MHGTTVLLALGHKHDGTVLALADAPPDKLGKLVDIGTVFRNDGRFRTGSDGAVLRQEAGVAAHHLHEKDAVVRGGRVADLVDAVDDGVERRIVADGRIGAVEIVVDRAGKADHRHVVFAGEIFGAGKRAVAADHDQGVDMVVVQHFKGLGAAFRRPEFLAAGGLENRAAPLDDIADRFAGKFLDFAVDQAFIAPVDTVHFPACEDGGTRDRADGGIHSRRIAAGSQDADGMDFFHRFCVF